MDGLDDDHTGPAEDQKPLVENGEALEPAWASAPGREPSQGASDLIRLRALSPPPPSPSFGCRPRTFYVHAEQ
jgi:hypothetical protein